MWLALSNYLFDCPFKKHFGLECFGCGFQRSGVLLTEGKIIESIKMYPATLPIMVLWIILIGHLIFKLKQGARIVQYGFIICAIIIVINYIYKLFYGYPT